MGASGRGNFASIGEIIDVSGGTTKDLNNLSPGKANDLQHCCESKNTVV